nr:helix-turn-helix transcriptional regulator [Paramagnetospirillum kuznetsovii]
MKPNPIDVYVGARLRSRRSVLGLSQEALGAAMGLTFQQVQKYERGANRIGASRLFDLARALGVDVDYFYAEMSDELKATCPSHAAGTLPESQLRQIDLLGNRETLDLVRAYYRIGDPEVRKRVHQLAKSLAGFSGP